MLTDELRQKLIQAAREARQWAYAPYSGYAVGAALLTASGRMYDGVNVENAAYPTGICAERGAVFKAISEGERELRRLPLSRSMAGLPVARAGRCWQNLVCKRLCCLRMVTASSS